MAYVSRHDEVLISTHFLHTAVTLHALTTLHTPPSFSTEEAWSTSLQDSYKSLMIIFNLVIINISLSSADFVILLFILFPNNLLGAPLKFFLLFPIF